MTNRQLIDKLNQNRSLEIAEWEQLIKSYTKDDLDYAIQMAQAIAISRFGKKIYFRGII